MRAARGQGGQGAQFDFGGMDLGDLFGGMFGSARGGQGRSQRGSDIQVDVKLTFREAVFGVEKEVRLHKLNSCSVCNGNGSEPGSSLKTCDECKGQGQVRRVQQTIFGAMQSAAVCSTCAGRGQVPEKRCKNCTGTGRIKSDSKYTVKIPAGIDTGGTIRLSGYGESGGAAGVSGDLYVVIGTKDEKENYAVRAYFKPLIWLIWLGCAMIFLAMINKIISLNFARF
jgi:molecular chaperone DnaJ